MQTYLIAHTPEQFRCNHYLDVMRHGVFLDFRGNWRDNPEQARYFSILGDAIKAYADLCHTCRQPGYLHVLGHSDGERCTQIARRRILAQPVEA